MFWERRLGHWVDDLRQHASLPLRVELWNGRSLDLGQQAQVTVRIPNPAALSYLLSPSLYNLGRAYVEGKIEIEGRVNEIIAVATTLAAQTLKPVGKFARLARSACHTRRRDEKAVRYHYDVSNEFYQKWLDENMVYSCAYFEKGDEDLGTAQIKKIDHILNKIQLRPGQRLLDIGCGWGGLVIRAAQKYGARCVGVTLSRNQYDLARERVQRAGLSGQVEVRLEDYRDLTGRYDRVTAWA